MPQAARHLLTTLVLIVLGDSSMYEVSVVRHALQAEFGVPEAGRHVGGFHSRPFGLRPLHAQLLLCVAAVAWGAECRAGPLTRRHLLSLSIVGRLLAA